MTSFWKSAPGILPNLTIEQEGEIEELTGRIPILLRVLTEVYHDMKQKEGSGASREAIVESLIGALMESEVVTLMKEQISAHAHKQISLLRKDNINVLNKYASYITVISYLISLTIHSFQDPWTNCIYEYRMESNMAKYLDRRYFYIDESGYGRSTCGIARTHASRCIQQFQTLSEHLSPEWLIGLSLAKSAPYLMSTPSVRSCILEKIVLAHLLTRGCSAAGPAFNQRPRLVNFSGQFPMATPRASNVVSEKHPRAIYVPLTFNYGSIDCALVNVEDIKGKLTGTVIGIQITCAKGHENSRKSFVERSNDWRMILRCDDIQVKYLWIVKDLPKGERAKKWVAMEQTPQHEEMFLRVSDLAPEIGKALDEACSADASEWQ